MDTSAIVAYLDQLDPHHRTALEVIDREPGPLVIPAGILAEVCYFIERGMPSGVLPAFLADIRDGAYSLDCGENDISRILELVERYNDLGLGFADSAVIACAERRGGRVLTFDLRHFGVVAREGVIRLLP